MNEKFNKQATSVVKGIAILLMLVHHNYLDPSRYKGYFVDFAPFPEAKVNLVANFFKICVGIFAFISGYGITLSIKKLNEEYMLTRKQTVETTIRRYFSMMSGYWFIFILALLLPYPTATKRIPKVYGTGILSLIYMLIDFLGLSHMAGTPINCTTWWYMSLATLIIILMPILLQLYHKYSFLLFLAVLFIPRSMGIPMNDVIRWFPVVILGIICADLNLLAKMKAFHFVNNGILNKGIKFCICVPLLVFFIFARKMDGIRGFYEIWDGVVPAFVVYVIFEFIVDIKGLNSVLDFIGKHSMNIFLTHTFLRQTYYKDFFYSFHNAWINILVLLAVSLALSILIEWLKSVTKYNSLMKYLSNKAASLANHI